MRMRFPYIYQLILGFFTVIVTLMVVTYFSFLHFGRTQLLDQVEEDFFEYAELIYEAELNADKEKLDAYEDILKNRKIEYGIFNKEGFLEYPRNKQNMNLHLSKEDLTKLQADEDILLRIHETDLVGNKKDTVTVYIPVFDEKNNYNGFIGVGRPVSHIDIVMYEIKKNIFKTFIIASLIALVVSVLFSYFLVKRINRLSKASKRVANGDYDLYIDHSNRDEIDRLSADFNKMIKALKNWREEVNLSENRQKTLMQDVTHEMKTPLTTINGLLEGLEHGVFSEEQSARSIKIMKKETTRLVRLINENLDYENIQSNQIILNKEFFPLQLAVSETEAQLKKLAKKENNKVILSKRISEINLYADYDRFKQILVNLLKNALQFTTNGEIKIDAFNEEKYTVITITDNGIGMTAEEEKNIWNRYYKADPSRKNIKYGESGLGLPIVKKLIELHDGKIELKTRIHEGSCFILYFPRKKSKESVKNQ